MFELTQPTKAKLIKYDTLSQKNRPLDEKPGVKLVFEVQLPAELLDQLEPSIRVFAYEEGKGKKASQASLEGVPVVSSTPHLTQAAMKVGKIAWHYDLTGYEVVIVRGLGGAPSNIPLNDCILQFPSIAFKEGGTWIGRMIVEVGNVQDDAWLEFARLKSRDCELTAKPPEIKQQSLEDKEGEAFEKGAQAAIAKARKPGASERAAVAKVKGGKAEAPVGKTHRVKPGASKDGAWPFPKGDKPTAEAPPQSVTIERSQPGTRTARGREATAKFLAAHAKGEGEAAKP
jgi:hypothetical protein